MKMKIELQKAIVVKNNQPEPIHRLVGKNGIELYYSIYNELNMQNSTLKNQLIRYYNEYYCNRD